MKQRSVNLTRPLLKIGSWLRVNIDLKIRRKECSIGAEEFFSKTSGSSFYWWILYWFHKNISDQGWSSKNESYKKSSGWITTTSLQAWIQSRSFHTITWPLTSMSCLRKFQKSIFAAVCRQNQNFDFKSGFIVEFRVECYVLIYGLYWVYTFFHSIQLFTPTQLFLSCETSVRPINKQCQIHHSLPNLTLNPNFYSKKLFCPYLNRFLKFA